MQSEIIDSWGEITSDNLRERTNFDEYQKEFLKLFGFGIDGVDYEKEVDLISPFTAL